MSTRVKNALADCNRHVDDLFTGLDKCDRIVEETQAIYREYVDRVKGNKT